MNHRQKRFCEEYLIDLNATQAAIRAGYNPKSAGRNADRLMKKDEISAYINETLEKIHSDKVADVQEVMEYLTAVMRGEYTDKTLCLIGDGQQTIVDIAVPTKDRLKAAELIGKRYAMFTDKAEFSTSPIIFYGSDLLEDGDSVSFQAVQS